MATLATGLNFKTAEDRSALFGGLYGSLAGLTVDLAGTVYVADSGNRRVLKIDGDGKVSVFARAEAPYFPTGVVATPAGDLYVLEAGFTLPGTWSGPRVRKISTDGKHAVVAVVGTEGNTGNLKAAVARGAGASVESVFSFFSVEGRIEWAIVVLSIATLVPLAWHYRRRRQRQV